MPDLPMDEPTEIWNERRIAFRVLDAALHAESVPLLDTARSMPDGPGVYLVFYRGALEYYWPVGDGSYPVYAGSCRSLRERFVAHRGNARPVVSLRAGRDLTVIHVPTASVAAARYSEALLIAYLRPAWNERWLGGFGSRWQGSARRTQMPPPFSILHPGRRVAHGEGRVDPGDLIARLREHLAATTHPGLWSC